MSLIHRNALSARELAARRRNAQNSTGPRTRRGKARASLNALRHAERSALFLGHLGSLGMGPYAFFAVDRLLRGRVGPAFSPQAAILKSWLEERWPRWDRGWRAVARQEATPNEGRAHESRRRV